MCDLSELMSVTPHRHAIASHGQGGVWGVVCGRWSTQSIDPGTAGERALERGRGAGRG